MLQFIEKYSLPFLPFYILYGGRRAKLISLLLSIYIYIKSRRVLEIKNKIITRNIDVFEPLKQWARIYCGGGQLSLGNIGIVVDQEKVLEFSTGKQCLTTKKPSQVNTIFRIYSLTKCVTSVAVMILIERGLLSLDDELGEYIPSFKNMKVYVSGSSMANLETREAKRQITIRHLLSHQSGLTYGTSVNHVIDTLYQEEFSLGLFSYSMEEFVEKVSKLPLMFDPGDHFTYSVATDVLAFLIEKITLKEYSLSYRDFIKTELFEKLEMNDTDFYVPKSKLNRLATLYKTSEEEGFGLSPAHSYLTSLGLGEPPKMISGGGGLFSTLEDYTTFIKIFVNYGEVGGLRFLSENSVKLLTHENQFGEYFCEERSENFGVDLSMRHFSQEKLKDYHYYQGIAFSLMGSVMVDKSKAFGSEYSHHGEHGWTGLGGLCFQVCHLPIKKVGKKTTIGVGLLFMSQTMPDKALPILPQFRWCGMKCVREHIEQQGYELLES